MATCVVCGKPAGVFSSLHPQCRPEAERRVAASDAARSAKEAATSSPAAFSSTPNTPTGVILCNVLGIVFLLAGLYFLVLEPGNPLADALPDSVAGIRVVNFQRLAMGQAFTVAGAIFLAAAWTRR